jgi:hypothetical protein
MRSRNAIGTDDPPECFSSGFCADVQHSRDMTLELDLRDVCPVAVVVRNSRADSEAVNLHAKLVRKPHEWMEGGVWRRVSF